MAPAVLTSCRTSLWPLAPDLGRVRDVDEPLNMAGSSRCRQGWLGYGENRHGENRPPRRGCLPLESCSRAGAGGSSPAKLASAMEPTFVAKSASVSCIERGTTADARAASSGERGAGERGSTSRDRIALPSPSGCRASLWPTLWPTSLHVHMQRGRAALSDDLLLGLTLATIREQIAGLPSDAVAIARQRKPAHEDIGKLGLDGYTNQEIIKMRTKQSGCSVCQELHSAGVIGVGPATHFLSWWLGTPLEDVMTALEAYEAAHPEQAPIFWWMCDYSFSQNSLSGHSIPLEERLATIIDTLGHTVMVLDPWDAPATLGRIWCLWEILQTQQTEARFEVAMSSTQNDRFVHALVDAFDSIAKATSRVSVRTADAFDPADRERILAAVDSSVGAGELNTRVAGLVAAALAQCGRAALDLLPVGERGTSRLIFHLGRLLKEQGDLDGAETLLREAVEARRKMVGIVRGFPIGCYGLAFVVVGFVTLIRIASPFGSSFFKSTLLLSGLCFGCAMAAIGYEVRTGTLYGYDYLEDVQVEAFTAIGSLSTLLREKGDLDGAEALLREAVKGSRETLGDRDQTTLALIADLGSVLQSKGDLDGGELLCREALEGVEAIGDRQGTLFFMNNLGRLLAEKGDPDAEVLLREVVEGRREVLGDRHQDTLHSIANLSIILIDKGDLDAAEALLREVLEASRETLGDRHPSTLVSMAHLGYVLTEKGDLDDAEPLHVSALQGQRETHGGSHPGTLKMIGNYADMLREKGDLSGARRAIGDAPEKARDTLGANHRYTLHIEAQAAHIKIEFGEADANALREIVTRMEEALGLEHPLTRGYSTIVGAYTP